MRISLHETYENCIASEKFINLNCPVLLGILLEP